MAKPTDVVSNGFDPYNPFHPEIHANPYPAYTELRNQAPRHFSPLFDAWMLTRYEDVVAILKEPRLTARRVPRFFRDIAADQRPKVQSLQAGLELWLLFKDPPDHTRMRTLINKAFVPGVVERMRPKIEAVIDELLDAVEAKGEFEIMRDLAYPLPVIVIGEVLGVPREDRELLKRWSVDIAAFFAGAHRPIAVAERAQQAMGEMTEYFREIVQARRKENKDDLIGALVAAEEQGAMLDDKELLATCVMLLFAGHETTTNLIGNGMVSLVRHPEEWELLREDLSLVPSAVEEFLRYESPVQFTARAALEPFEYKDLQIKQGDLLFLLLGAANRDPRRFENPDKLEIRRKDNKHLAFAQGIHFCPGAPLSRLEAQMVFSKVLSRFPNLRSRTDTVRWQQIMSFRAVNAIHLEW